MDIVSACPLRVASIVWQPRPFAFALTVVCKATFTLAPEASALAGVQDEPILRDIYWSDDERASLRYPSDLVPFKRRADVLLVGHAYAPAGKPVTSLLVRLLVGEIDKTIEVHGDRWVTFDEQIHDAAPFVRAPLHWERAAGGAGTSNPVGMRLDVADRRGAVALPSLTPPHVHVTGRRDVVAPIGLGPIAPSWPERAHKLRHHAAGWDHERWNASALPADLDAGYFNTAPADQQVQELRAGDRIVLENLHPEHPRLVTNLQAVVPCAHVDSGQEVRLRCDTLSIDTDRGVASLVWRGMVLLEHPAQAGRVVVTANAPALPKVMTAPAELRETLPIDSTLAREIAALPFRPALLKVAKVPPELSRTLPIDPARVPQGATLPFGPAMSAPLPSIVTAAADLRGTLPIDSAAAPQGAALPFGPAAGMVRERCDVAAGVPAPQVAVVECPPPSMIGPLATPEMFQRTQPSEPAPAPKDEPKPPQQPASVQPQERPLRVADYPLDRCAAIAASIARRSAERDDILKENKLSPCDWEALGHHWADELRKERTRGKTARLEAYDDAYVARLEQERGPIEPAEYARLLVAAERGTEAETLAELSMPRGALARVQRVWLRRMVASPAVEEAVRAAVEKARG